MHSTVPDIEYMNLCVLVFMYCIRSVDFSCWFYQSCNIFSKHLIKKNTSWRWKWRYRKCMGWIGKSNVESLKKKAKVRWNNIAEKKRKKKRFWIGLELENMNRNFLRSKLALFSLNANKSLVFIYIYWFKVDTNHVCGFTTQHNYHWAEIPLKLSIYNRKLLKYLKAHYIANTLNTINNFLHFPFHSIKERLLLSDLYKLYRLNATICHIFWYTIL